MSDDFENFRAPGTRFGLIFLGAILVLAVVFIAIAAITTKSM